MAFVFRSRLRIEDAAPHVAWEDEKQATEDIRETPWVVRNTFLEVPEEALKMLFSFSWIYRYDQICVQTVFFFFFLVIE